MQNNIFLDTSFSIALSIEKDAYHERAVFLAEQIKRENIQIFTSQAVLLEIGNALSKLKYRLSAIRILEKLQNDSTIFVISLTDELFDAVFELFSNRPDKEWGLIDCVSFVVMREKNIEAALTADEHFVQAGFRALLLEQQF